MKKLAISFVTFNRAKHIKEDLDIIAQPTKDLNIDIYIYDGSTNGFSEYVVNKFLKEGNNHIHYFHMINVSSKERVSNALHCPEAEYVWLCGDKFVIKPEYYSQILSLGGPWFQRCGPHRPGCPGGCSQNRNRRRAGAGGESGPDQIEPQF